MIYDFELGVLFLKNLTSEPKVAKTLSHLMIWIECHVSGGS
jgi:hypothetical protein